MSKDGKIISIPKILSMVIIFLIPFFTYAQTPNPTEILKQYQYKALKDAYLAQSVTIETTPANPGPETNVKIKVISYEVDLNTSYFIWKVNGETKDSGRSIKEFSFKTGKSNEKILVSVTITHKDGSTFTRNINFGVGDVDLLWEADSYTPELYKGKALLPLGGKLRVIAIPHILNANGNKVPENELVFTWSEKDKVLASKSGNGRNILDLRDNPKTGPREIKVSVSNLEKSITAERSIYIPYVPTEIVVYEENSLFGPLYSQALSNSYARKASNLTLLAEPFFSSVNNTLGESLVMEWKNNSGTSLAKGRKISLTAPQEGRGVSNLTISMKSKINVLEKTSSSIQISLEKND